MIGSADDADARYILLETGRNGMALKGGAKEGRREKKGAMTKFGRTIFG